MMGRYDTSQCYMSLEEAVDEHVSLRKRAGEEKNNKKLQRELASSFDHLGRLCEDKGNIADAQQHYQEALVIREKIAIDESNSVKSLIDLATSYWNISDVSFGDERLCTAKKGWLLLSELEKKGLLDKKMKEWRSLFYVQAGAPVTPIFVVKAIITCIISLGIIVGCVLLGLYNSWLWIIGGPISMIAIGLICMEVASIFSFQARQMDEIAKRKKLVV